MPDRLRNKVALITGAGSGIGAAMAELFAAEGAMVVLADIDESRANTVAGVLPAPAVHIVSCNVAISADVKNAVDVTVKAFGKLDILCNNAGIEGKMALTTDYPEDEFDRVMAVNLKGVFLGMKHAIPAMLQNGGGTIVNTASIAGLVGLRGSIAYNTSKAGVIQMTRTVALEYARKNIRVNAIAPGFVDTPMLNRISQVSKATREALEQPGPLGRKAAPKEIALAALYLASDESSFVTGAVLAIDGGFIAA